MVLTRVLLWAGLALFVYFLLARLRTLAVLIGAQRGLREAAAVRIRPLRIAVETVVLAAVLSLWATRAFNRGRLDWEVGGSGSPLHLELGGAWFILGVLGLIAALAALLFFAGLVAWVRADYLREQFPRPTRGRPHILRLAVMNPDAVFLAPRRSPFLWVWTEVRAAAFGFLTTLALEAVGHESPAASGQVAEVVNEASDEFELEERLMAGGRALTWDELLTLLAGVAGVPPVEPSRLNLPPVDVPISPRAMGVLLGLFNGAMKTRRKTQQETILARFDERASIRAILEEAPGSVARAYLAGNLDVLLDQVRGEVFDSLRQQLPPRQGRHLAKAYRRDGMEGAAAWMVEQIPDYPGLFQHSVYAELKRQTSFADSVASRIQKTRRQGDPDPA